MNGTVYAISCAVTGERYVGGTKDFRRRRGHHRRQLRAGTHPVLRLQAAYDLYGEASIVFTVIEFGIESQDQLDAREQAAIDERSDFNASKVAGKRVRLGMKSRPEHVARMSAALKGRVGPNKGKKFSAEHRRRMSEAQKGNTNTRGRVLSEETKAKMRANHNPISDRNLNRLGGTYGRRSKTTGPVDCC